jgi:hypothetical protein
MTVLLQEQTVISIFNEIKAHPAWHGMISGMNAEKMLRGRKIPYLYLLRAGEFEDERETDYYVTFTLPTLSIMHQPFTITTTPQGWYFEQGTGGGPFTHASLDDVLHLIMHCHKDACSPLKKMT